MTKCPINGLSLEAFPYLNLMKAAGSFTAGTSAYPGSVNQKGYPTGPLSVNLGGNVAPFPTTYTGHWIFKFSGTGRFVINTGAPGTTVHSGSSFVVGSTAFSMDVSGTNARVEFSFNSIPGTLSIYFPSSGTYSGMSNAVLCRAQDEAAVDAGQIFNPDCIAAHRALNPGIIRTLVWANPNDGNLQTSSDFDVPSDAFSYHLGVWVPGRWAGDIAGTDTYTCSAGTDTPVTWTDGEIIQGRFLNANTSITPTLNVGGRGAKTIVDEFVTFNLGVGNISANQIATLVYDATLDKLMHKSGPLRSKVPLSAVIRMANDFNVDVWWNVPHLLNDASILSVATYAKANLNPGLTFHVEYSNEVWNPGAGFPQTFYAMARGNAAGIPNDTDRSLHFWYGKRSAEIFDIFDGVWAGATSPGLKKVLAWQGAGGGQIITYRLGGADLGPYGFSTFPNRPGDKADAFSYATYYYGRNALQFDAEYNGALTTLLGWADNYASGSPALMSSALDALDTDIRGTSTSGETMKHFNDIIYPTWNAAAVTYGKYVDLYEGCLSIAAPSASRLTALGIDTAYSAKIDNLFTAYKHDRRCYNVVTDQLNQFMAQSRSRTPMWFLAYGVTQWSAHQNDLFSAPWQSWNALVDYNNPLTLGGGGSAASPALAEHHVQQHLEKRRPKSLHPAPPRIPDTRRSDIVSNFRSNRKDVDDEPAPRNYTRRMMIDD